MDGVVFGNFSVTFGDGHGARLERAPLGVSRPAPVRRQGGGSGPVPYAVGRGEELALAGRTVRDRGAVEFVGPCGAGKTTLLRNAGADTYVRVGGTAVADLLQDLMREFYVYPAGGVRLSGEQCRAVLAQVGAVVALDDVAYGAAGMALLRGALAGCGLVVGAGRPVLGALGQSRTLPGLSQAAAVALLARETGRYLGDAEMPAVGRLVAAVGGQPLALRQAAALVRYDGHDWASLADRAAADPGVLDELSISALGPQAKRALAVLSLLGGALLPGELVARLTDATFVLSELEELRNRGLAEQREDRFGLPVCKAEPYRHILYRYLGVGAALRALADWLASADPYGAGVREVADAAVTLLGFGAEAREWQGVLRLTAVAERVLFVQGDRKSVV